MNKMDLTQRLENCYSGAVFDVMRELELKDGLLPRHLKSLDPEVTVCGPVSTVLGRPDSSLTEDESLTLDRTLGQGSGRSCGGLSTPG